jgi:hypothetical protein
MLKQVNRCRRPIPPASQHTDSVRVNLGRNHEGIVHVIRNNAFAEKLRLIQVAHILRLNVLVLVRQLFIGVLCTEVFRRAKQFRQYSSG